MPRSRRSADGHAIFEIDGETVDAPAGTFVSARPEARPKATGDATVLALGGTPGEPYQAMDWGEAWKEHEESMEAYNEQRYADAAAAVRRALEQHPDHAGLNYNYACFSSLAGEVDDDTFAHLPPRLGAAIRHGGAAERAERVLPRQFASAARAGHRASLRPLAKSLFEPRVVAHRVEVAVAASLLAERREALDALLVKPADADQAAWLHSLAALAYLQTDDLPAAREAASQAENAGSSIPVVVEARALVALVTASRARAAGKSPDYSAVGEAADDFAELRSRLANVERWQEAGGLLAYAVQSLVLAARDDDARALLETASIEERSTAGLRLGLAALEASDYQAAVGLLEPNLNELDDEGRVAYAAALLQTDADRFRTEGLKLLDEVIGNEASPWRLEAAWFLAGAMGVIGEFDAGLSALTLLQEHDPPRAAIVQARLLEDSDPAAADALLLRHQDDERVLRTRLQLAVEGDDRSTALALFNRVLERDRDPEIALWRATFLYEAETPATALAAALPIARDVTVPIPIRRAAYGITARWTFDVGDLENHLVILREWHELDAHNRGVLNQLLRVLAALGRAADAKALLEAANFEPDSLPEAELVGHIIYATESGADRLQHLTELSDRFARNEESVELKIIVAALSTPEDDLPAALAARVRQTFTDFPERFPHSKGLVSIPVEEFQERVIDPLRERAERGQDAYNEVAKGALPVAALAAQAGRSAAEIWPWLRPLPTGFGSLDLDEAEVDAASKSIDGAVVVDSIALTTLALMAPHVRSASLAALPGSMIAQAVLNDLLVALPLPEAKGGPQVSLEWDLEADAPRAVTISEEDSQAIREQASNARALGEQLNAVADTADESSGRINEWLRTHDPRGALRTLAATLAVAERTGAAVYSDDRVVRREAREIGVEAFGTFALLRALAAKQVLSNESVEEARMTLFDYGAQGIGLRGGQLIDRMRADAFRPSRLTEASLTDPAPWRNDTDRALMEVLEIFEVVYENKPDVLTDWLELALRGMRGAWPNVPAAEFSALLLRRIVERSGEGPLANSIRSIRSTMQADDDDTD